VEDFSRVLGVKMVDFYITQVGANTTSLNTNIAKHVDVLCPNIPQVAQMLDERHGHIFARVPLERHFTGTDGILLRDKQWKSFNRKTNYFNPMSIQKLDFEIFEEQDDGDYVKLNPATKWHMILEVTTVDHKETPISKETQILEAIHALIGKIEKLHQSVERLPTKEEAEKIIKETEKKRKKISFNYILLALAALVGGYIYYVNKIKMVPGIM
tara:strand:+ start:1348 stop:1986 length:639 start_codon:yes stop_codon:yes gene_type:complete